MKKTRASRFSILISLVCLLFTFLLWDHYFNSSEAIDRTVAANLILLMGSLFSVSLGLFTWSLENHRHFLESELKKKDAELSLKNADNRRADIHSSAIYEASQILFSDMKIQAVLDKVIDLMGRVFYADEGSIMLLNNRRELYIAASIGIPEDIVRGVQIQIGERVAGRAAKERRPFLLIDGLESYKDFQGLEPNPRIRSSIVCPLICQSEVLGVLNLNRVSRGENFTVSDLMNASIFAAQVAQAVKNATLYETLERKLAELDPWDGRLAS